MEQTRLMHRTYWPELTQEIACPKCTATMGVQPKHWTPCPNEACEAEVLMQVQGWWREPLPEDAAVYRAPADFLVTRPGRGIRPCPPVALFLFNRSALTAQVFARIAEAQPSILFLIADGPRPGHPIDAERCAEARTVVEHIDWPCQIIREYADRNVGLPGRIVSGLELVFALVERCIILEDDCLPAPAFFRFCAAMLERYQNVPEVWQVNGYRHLPGPSPTADSYYLSRNRRPGAGRRGVERGSSMMCVSRPGASGARGHGSSMWWGIHEPLAISGTSLTARGGGSCGPGQHSGRLACGTLGGSVWLRPWT